MFKFAGIILACLALGLAGCTTVPTEPPTGENPPPVWPATNGVARMVVPPPVAPPVLPPAHVLPPSTNLNQPDIHFNPPPPHPVPPAPVTTWTALNRWAAEHHAGAPRRLTTSPVVSYTLSTRRGVMGLTIGSREATWNGTTINLGFAPEIIDDQVFVHGLDLEKSLEPLLDETPVLPETNRIIVLDPGHGGREPGALCVLDNQPEKTFTLDWARRLAPLLEANGWRVFLTRTNDTELSVTNRYLFATAHHADLFISLHFNSGGLDHKPAGLETYCLTPTGMPSTVTRGYPDITSQNYPVNAYDTGSLWLALTVHNAILRATHEEDRGVRHARYLTVLRGQHCPAVLIEGGYLTNPQEAAQIERADYRQKLAEAVARALP